MAWVVSCLEPIFAPLDSKDSIELKTAIQMSYEKSAFAGILHELHTIGQGKARIGQENSFLRQL